jgi:hypothetical protein
MNTPVTTLGRGAIVPLTRRLLRYPIAILLLSVAIMVLTHEPGWLSVGGAAISAIGTRHWATRLFRDPRRSDAGLPPTTLPDPQGRGPGVLLNPAAMTELGQRARDNWSAYLGVWMSIFGGIIGSAGPFLMDLVWPASR